MNYSNTDSKENGSKRIIQLYYPALMTFIVFTIAGNLMQEVLRSSTLEIVLLLLLCVFIAIHLTSSYLRIADCSKDSYHALTLVFDCLDMLCITYLCAAIVCFSKDSEGISYVHLSIPFLVVSINQFFWFVFMRLKDKPALIRLCILFIGMTLITALEFVCHSIWNLVAIDLIVALLGVMRIINVISGRQRSRC